MKHLEVTCPSCSPDHPVLHDVLKHRRGGTGDDIHVEATVKCGDCGHVHRAEVRVPKPIDIRLIVSRGEESRTEKVTLFPGETVEVGQDLDDVEVTSIEVGDRRVERAEAQEVDAIWAREVDRVEVPYSLHVGDSTFAEKKEMEGDDWVNVGDRLRARGFMFRVDSILTRDGEKKERAQAKDVKRVYAAAKRAKKR